MTNDRKNYRDRTARIFDYATNEMAKPYMYLDDRKGPLFHAMPTASKTANTKYTRSELRADGAWRQ